MTHKAYNLAAVEVEMSLSSEQISEIERRFGDVRDMGDHYIVSVDGNGSEDETEAILVELQQFLGSAWICEWTGCSNTDDYGCTAEDISVSPKPTLTVEADPPPEKIFRPCAFFS